MIKLFSLIFYLYISVRGLVCATSVNQQISAQTHSKIKNYNELMSHLCLNIINDIQSIKCPHICLYLNC